MENFISGDSLKRERKTGYRTGLSKFVKEKGVSKQPVENQNRLDCPRELIEPDGSGM